MLTINATEYPLMKLFHKPVDEKRMVIILPDEHYNDWLNAPVETSLGWLRPYPAQALHATAPMANQTSMF